ncbi:alpha/beta hydrolase [Agromyces neolithicus]|uniref:Dienelactone hydrolase family protein n=1 Tax=Agromyces neolithicus TaxID=269420 RepID=A0ABN2M7U3_9MICO
MATVRIDDDSVLWSASEADRAGRPLLLLLHGFNSNEGDLFGLSPYLPLEPAIASLRAPSFTGYGYAWFPLLAQGREQALAAAAAATDAIIEWLDRTAAEHSTIGLLGFSQGGAMALELMRRDPERFAFAVNLSGFAMPGVRDEDEHLQQVAPPVFWGRGTDDGVIDATFIAHTIEWLPAHADLDQRTYEGLAHSISEVELSDAAAFIAKQLAAAAG